VDIYFFKRLASGRLSDGSPIASTGGEYYGAKGNLAQRDLKLYLSIKKGGGISKQQSVRGA